MSPGSGTEAAPEFETVVCVTGQHREMLDQILQCFQVTPQYDLAIMRDKQTLFDVTVSILEKLRAILESEKPDVVLVHGDTSTAFVTALACFYLQIPVGHVEAGLRTYNLYSPFPEEFNRQAVDLIARFYFAPTELSRQNLLKEGKLAEHIFVTGNTVIDALDTTVRSDYTHRKSNGPAAAGSFCSRRTAAKPGRAHAGDVPGPSPHRG